MKLLPLALALLFLTSALAPQGQAQAQPTVDAAVLDLAVDPEPVTNVSSVATATVFTRTPGTITVTFTYADGAPLRGSDDPGGLGHTLTRFVETGGSHAFSLPFTPPWERRGDATLRAVVQMNGDSDPTNDTIERRFFVQNPSLNLTFEEHPSLYVLPQGLTPLRYVLRNDGNFNETPLVRIENGTNWTLVDSLHVLPLVPPGGHATGVLFVAPLEGAGNLSLNVTASSSIRPSHRVTTQAPPLRPADNETFATRALALAGVPPLVQAFDNETVSHGFLVRNDGERPEVVVLNATLSNATHGWRATLNVTGSWPEGLARPPNGTSIRLAIPPGGSLPLSVNVTRGAGAAPNLSLRVEATLANAPLLAAVATPRHVAREDVALRVAAPDLRLVSLRAPDRIYRDDAVVVQVDARNFGRVATNLTRLDLDVADALRVARNATLEVPSLAPGETRSLSWTFRADGMQGLYSLVAALRDPRASAAPQRLDLHVRSPAISLLSPAEIVASPGTTLRLSALPAGFGVHNSGDRAETIVVEMTSAHPWLASRWEISVAPSGTEALPLEIEVPGRVDALSYPVTVRAWVRDRPAFEAVVETEVRVEDEDSPALEFVGPTAPGAVGRRVELAVRVLDATGFGDGEVLVRLPDGTHQSLLLQANASDPDVAWAQFVPRQPGEHVLEFRVGDAARVAGRTSLGNLTWRVDAPAYAGLRPVGFDEGASVGTARLRLEEVAPGTTATLHVDVGRGLELVPPPYEFSLPAREGRHVVHARATSLEGVVTETSWNVTLDRTPPSVEGSWRPAADGYLEIDAVAGDGAQSVVVRFATPSGSQDAPLERRSATSFGARVAPPEGWTQVTLIATDAAGNEAPFAMAAPEAQTPASGLLALLALLCAACAGRRRGRLG